MDYKDFKKEDFLKDEFFIQWIKKGNPEANHFWDSWLESHPEKLTEIQNAREIVEKIGYGKKAHIDQILYNDVLESIYRDENFQYRLEYGRKRSWFSLTTRVAAILLFLIVSSAVFWLVYNQYLIKNPMSDSDKMVIKESPLGAKTTFMLDDGSKIVLNGGSKLTYDESFGVDARQVYLEGEAFFEVTKDSYHPFIVHTGKIQTKALGTSFNVNAYPDESTIKIALVSGKIAITDQNGTFEKKLLPDEMASLNRTGRELKISSFDTEDVIGWKDGLIVFNSASFDEVTSVLSRWFNVQFKFIDNKKIKGNFTGKFDNKTLHEILDGLSFATQFDFEIKGKEVIIK